MIGAEIVDICPPPAQPPSPRSQASGGSRRLRMVGLALIVALACCLVAAFVVARPLRVLQQSMEDTLQPGQYVLTDPVIPALLGYGRGDVVMVRLPGGSPDDPAFPYRVIGLPGDTIDLRNGRVLVDGHQISEPYVYETQPTEPVTGQAHWMVPPRTLFVLGDRRQNAADSRVYGPIPFADLVGRAWLRCWPLDSLGFISAP